ncbi:hypothetical protein IWW50_005591, partial [Coemansia erecta]
MSRQEQFVDEDDGFEIESPFDAGAAAAKRPDLSGTLGGRMGGGAGPQAAYTSNALPGGYHTNTLDEPILTTIGRDFGKVGRKTVQVLYPKGRDNALQEWDLWGPLFFCLSLAIIMSFLAPDQQASAVFTGVFALVCIGSCVVTLNCKLL